MWLFAVMVAVTLGMRFVTRAVHGPLQSVRLQVGPEFAVFLDGERSGERVRWRSRTLGTALGEGTLTAAEWDAFERDMEALGAWGMDSDLNLAVEDAPSLHLTLRDDSGRSHELALFEPTTLAGRTLDARLHDPSRWPGRELCASREQFRRRAEERYRQGKPWFQRMPPELQAPGRSYRDRPEY